MRRCSRSNGPVAAFCVWSFCRNPAGSSALCQDRGVSGKEDVCLTDTLLPSSLAVYGGNTEDTCAVTWGCGCELRADVPGISEALLALTFCVERRAPNECRQNIDGWSSPWVFCSDDKRPTPLHGLFPYRSLAKSATKVLPGRHMKALRMNQCNYTLLFLTPLLGKPPSRYI